MHALRTRTPVPAPPRPRLAPRPRVASRPGRGHTAQPTATPPTITLDAGVASAEADVAAATGGQHFDWGAAWYPVACVDSLPTDRPTKVELLGRELVVFYDGNRWAAFADRCPHRAVPLSEGRLDVDAADPALRNLACAYHGFRFRADGGCVAVPQAVTPAAEAEACASPRLCAEVYPSAARPDGLLWIWATAGDFERAAATPAGGHALLDTPDALTFITPWYARDIPCDTAEFLENVVDPCHVAFSHHGVLGSRYAPPWQAMKPAARPVAGHEETDPAVAEAEDAGGFAVKVALLGKTRPKDVTTPPPFPAKTTTMIWRPPVMARYDFGTTLSHMLIYATPTKPGFMRLFFAVYKKKADTPPVLRALFAVLAHPLFRFYGHWGNSVVLAGDNQLVAAQGARVRAAEAAGGSYKNIMFFPTSMDAAVARLRAWFQTSPVTWAPDAPPAPVAPPSKRDAIERTAHTSLCVHCRRSLAGFEAVRAVALAAAITAAVYFVGGLGAGRPPARAAAIVAAVGSAVAAAAHAAIARFIYVDYVHADKH